MTKLQRIGLILMMAGLVGFVQNNYEFASLCTMWAGVFLLIND